ncbi:putative B3 domain-containing protein Os04g0346900 isoform X3 [Zingiber officinale]|uniref:putative B3 domain-containing protein Os04g0346900 isoform X3 n=1 Tax=Zingiber officinale TaxID=94328 RepID=UPI001C4C224C|nr:putative B3 domain-containing protein Os04g0346900 isoform X3 [Zingiber officinale]
MGRRAQAHKHRDGRRGRRGRGRRRSVLKVLCPDSLRKLAIPRDFMKYIETKMEFRKAILISPLVKLWHIVIERPDKSNTMFFGSGWEKFVQAHSLGNGKMVGFRYEGNMVFTVKSALPEQTVAPSSARHSSTARVHNSSRHEQMVPAPSSSRVPSDSEESMTGTKRRRTLNTAAQDELPNTRGCSQASEPNLKWEVVVTTRSLGSLNIPKRFTCLDQFSREKGEVSVTDSRGRKWPIRLTHRTESALGRGLRLMAQENNVEEGDVCIFEVTSDKLIRLQVEKKPQRKKF